MGVLGVVVFAAQGHGDGVVVAVADAGLRAAGVSVKGLDKAGAGERLALYSAEHAPPRI